MIAVSQAAFGRQKIMQNYYQTSFADEKHLEGLSMQYQ